MQIRQRELRRRRKRAAERYKARLKQQTAEPPKPAPKSRASKRA